MGLFDFLRGDSGESNYAIALDIGTEFVKALIFRIEDGKGHILGVGRQRQRLTDMQGGAVTDISGVIKNSELAIGRAYEKAKVMPRQVIVGIAGELVKGTTTVIKYSRPNSAANITMAELKDVIGKVQRRAFDRARSVLTWETGHSELDVRLVNAAIVDVKIDSYRVTNPLGFQGKEIQVSVYNSFAPIVHLGALQTIANNLNLDLISVAAEPYAVAKCMEVGDSSDFSAIFIDIGGGTTDVAVVSNGGLAGTKMFALGGRAFTKRISDTLGISFSAAEEMKINYSKGKLSEAEAEKVSRALETDCQVWFSGVELTLSEFTNVDLLPSRILLCGGGSNLPEIKSTLEAAIWGKELPFAKKPKIGFVQPADVTNMIDETGELEDIADVTPMALGNVALELVGEQTVADSILSKIAAGLRS